MRGDRQERGPAAAFCSVWQVFPSRGATSLCPENVQGVLAGSALAYSHSTRYALHNLEYFTHLYFPAPGCQRSVQGRSPINREVVENMMGSIEKCKLKPCLQRSGWARPVANDILFLIHRFGQLDAWLQLNGSCWESGVMSSLPFLSWSFVSSLSLMI